MWRGIVWRGIVWTGLTTRLAAMLLRGCVSQAAIADRDPKVVFTIFHVLRGNPLLLGHLKRVVLCLVPHANIDVFGYYILVPHDCEAVIREIVHAIEDEKVGGLLVERAVRVTQKGTQTHRDASRPPLGWDGEEGEALVVRWGGMHGGLV